MAILPEELLELICFQLHPTAMDIEDDRIKRNTLLSMALASKACYRVARPVLYHSLDFRDQGLDGLRPLLRVLLTTLGTCNLVKELHVPCWETRFSRRLIHMQYNHGDHEELPNASSTLRGFGLPSLLESGLRSGIMECLQDGFLALLLLMCSGIQNIHLQTPYRYEQSLVSAIIDWTITLTNSHTHHVVRPLQSVHEVEIRHWDTEGATRMDQISAILQLPALKTFRGTMLEIDGTPPPSSVITSGLKQLHLRSSILSARGAEWLLARCPCLEKLYMHCGGSSTGRCSIEWDKISAAINRRCRNLQVLRLDAADADPLNSESLPIGSLRQVTSLRILTMSCGALFGDQADTEDGDEDFTPLTDLLPFSLETLRITQADDDDAEVHDELLWLLMTDERFAALKTVRVNRSEAFSEDLSGSSWDDSESNRFWVVLKRRP